MGWVSLKPITNIFILNRNPDILKATVFVYSIPIERKNSYFEEKKSKK